MEQKNRCGILVPLDGSSLAERAIPPAVALAAAGGLPVTLLRVVADAATQRTDCLGRGRPELAEADEYLEGVASRLTERGVTATTDIQSGEATEVILRRIAAIRPDFVILTTHGRSGFGRWVYGNVAEAVLSRSSAPVLLVRAAGPSIQLSPGNRYLRIVVPLDGSAFAEEAIPEAIRLASLLGAIIILVRAIAPVPSLVAGTTLGISVAEPGSPGLARAEVEASLSRVTAHLSRLGIRFRSRLVEGEPADAIIDACQNESAALIVMATHGRTGLRRLAFGSTAAEVLHRGRVPILFVRPAAVCV